MHNDSMIAGVGAALAAIAFSSFPALSGLVRQIRKRQSRDDAIYEDADGKATAASVQAFSNWLPKTAILLLAVIGAAASLAVSILVTFEVAHDGFLVEDWLSSAAWILMLLQALAITASHQSTQAYYYGLFLFVSAAIQTCIVLSQDAKVFEALFENSKLLFSLRIVEAAAVLLISCASVLLPRRPDVFYEGEIVDRMYTTTAYSRFTFSWPNELLSLSAKKNTLDLVDLPRPDHETRTQDVSDVWKHHNYSVKRLWLSIIQAHAFAFALQWILTFGTAILNFAPQWVILQLLRILETRNSTDPIGLDVWIWVLWLGLIIVAQSILESYVFWLSWAELTIPIRAQLAALVFEKAMRRKDVKSSRKKAKDTALDDSVDSANPAAAPDADNDDDDELEEAKKTKQGTVNLIGVDGKRVSEFCSFQNLFPGSLFKLVVSLAFLVSLLGWIPLLAGLSTMLIITPLNIMFSKKYADAQDRLMKLRDEKLAVITEALQGIRQIKFSALEPQWEAKIGEVRERELDSVWKVFVCDTVLITCWVTSPIALSAVSLTVYALIHGELTPSVAFVSLGVFRALEVTLSVVPEITTDLLDAWVSVKRLQDYLTTPDLEKVSIDSDIIKFENATVAWPSDEELEDSERFILRNINLTFPAGELSVISGKTGSGKSLLLAAILGEVDILSGTLYAPHSLSMDDRHDDKANKANWILPKSIAYIAQIPWIENATIKENIIFGLPIDEERYRKTVHACALTKDLEMLSDGENTEIGANGINLSGGQKWRITLARAIYSRAGVLVMDDIFSAVDAHVGRHIFDNCLNGELCSGRTRILVTHHVTLCAPKAKFLVELGEGGIAHAGLVADLAEDGTLDQIKQHEQAADEDEIPDAAEATAVNSDNSTDSDEVDPNDENDAENGGTLQKTTSKATQPAINAPQAQEARKFVEEEKREAGAVNRRVYAAYLRTSGGWPFWIGALILVTAAEVLGVGRSWWLRVWTGHYEDKSEVDAFNYSVNPQSMSHQYVYTFDHPISQVGGPGSSGLATIQSSDTVYYIGIYVVLALLSAALGSLRYYYIYNGSIWASRSLFAKLNFIVLRSPLRWLDTVPVGRVLNRFTSDFNIIDSQMANSIASGGNSFIHLFGVVAAGAMVSPLIVVLSCVLLVACTHFALLYIAAARPVKRLESTAKSPVFEQFGTALSGVATIRGFDKARVYIERMYRRLDDWSVTTWHLMLFNRWVGWRMALVGSFFSVVVASIILSTPGMDSALAGFALAFALDFATCVMWTVRLYANVELQMNAAERIIEYTELPTESLEGASPPAAWPTEGRIEVDNLVVSYAPDLPPVLKGLTFTVERNQRVGVVGRTGAGKSSLTLALFRFLEARSGSIHIDGLDISQIKLHDLRSRLAIIPQDPVLFSGTIRSNLDPFDTHSDEELRDCLARVHLSSPQSSGAATPVVPGTPGALSLLAPSDAQNTNIFNDLQSPVSEGGLNLSQGQRQLLCLARAIVRRPKVMVLDEATSAVDMHTDGLIQRSIREEFTDATLLVIAHRLSTIADFDRILVLKDGAVAEYGAPRDLWAKGPENSIFRAMCEESGEHDKLEKVVMG